MKKIAFFRFEMKLSTNDAGLWDFKGNQVFKCLFFEIICEDCRIAKGWVRRILPWVTKSAGDDCRWTEESI